MPVQMSEDDQLVRSEPGLVTALLSQPPVQPYDTTTDPDGFGEMIHDGYRTH
jgi:hypothetical protein